MPGLPELTATVAAQAAKLTALESSLASHKTRLESGLTELAAAIVSLQSTAQASGLPELIDLTNSLALNVTQTIDTLKAWSDGEVSQTFVDGLLP